MKTDEISQVYEEILRDQMGDLPFYSGLWPTTKKRLNQKARVEFFKRYPEQEKPWNAWMGFLKTFPGATEEQIYLATSEELQGQILQVAFAQAALRIAKENW